MNPSVTATISVNDAASPKLREIAALAKKISQTAGDNIKFGSADGLTSSLNRANVAAEKHLSIMGRIKSAHSAVAGVATGIASTAAVRGTLNAVKQYLPYEKEVRYQQAIQNFTPAAMDMLEKQRLEAATTFGLKPEDTLHGQMTLVQRNYSAEITKAGTQQAIILSKALNSSVSDAAKIAEGVTFGQGIHLKNAADATLHFKKSSDLSAVAAKAGGMTVEDISEFAKFGLGTSSAANVKPETAFAWGMALKRANVGGAESGVFMRQFGARLIAPTSKGRAALNAAGLNYSDYTTTGALDAENLSLALKDRFGKPLSTKSIGALKSRLDNDEEGEALKDRSSFVAAVVDEVSKNEKLSKTDQKHVSAVAGQQYDLARTGLDGDRLARDILKNFTPTQLQAYAGDKQAGRGNMLLAHRADVNEYQEKLEHSDGYAAEVAGRRMEGLGFAADRLSSSFDALEKTVVQANQGWLSAITSSVADLLGWGVGLSNSSKQVIGVTGSLTAFGVAALSAYRVLSAMRALAALPAALAAGAAGSSAVGAGAGVATAAAGVSSITIVGPVAITAAGVALSAIATNVLNQQSDETLKAVQNSFPDDNAVAAAIIMAGRGDDHSNDESYGLKGTHNADGPRDPVGEGIVSALKEFGSHISETATSLVRDAYSVLHGDYKDLGIKYGSPANDESYGLRGTHNADPIEVRGDISGLTKVESTITVEPSEWFKVLVRKMESAVDMAVSVKLGTTISGSNGTTPSKPGGIGHQ
jgi:hypothetical protein